MVNRLLFLVWNYEAKISYGLFLFSDPEGKAANFNIEAAANQQDGKKQHKPKEDIIHSLILEHFKRNRPH